MKAAPGPSVSGRYFLPKAPLLCTKRRPLASVMFLNSIAPLGGCDIGACLLAARTRASAKLVARNERISPGLRARWAHSRGGSLVGERGNCRAGPRRARGGGVGRCGAG